jgi:hypothetical protein
MTDVLESIQNLWGVHESEPGTDEAVPLAQCPAEPASISAAELERDVSRLKEIMREHPIRPHLHEGGGDGFSYPYSGDWREKHGDVIVEFSRLWFSDAGTIIVGQYGNRMRVIPLREWDKLVRVSGTDPGNSENRQKSDKFRAGTSSAPESQGSGQVRDFGA